MAQSIYLIIHNVRSCYNVGSLLRTADAFSVDKVLMSGYTPYPRMPNDKRLPHIANKMSHQIHKSALGAEDSVDWTHEDDAIELISKLRANGFLIAALEQTETALSLPSYILDRDIALIVGREVEGIEDEVLEEADIHLEIPMLGKKESLNVSAAGAAALYQLRFGLSKMDR